MSEMTAVILAAGDGKRMRSQQPKVLCEVLFKPMLGWVLDACEQAGITTSCIVTGYAHEQVEAYLQGRYAPASPYHTVLQSERHGTGHAVMQAESFLRLHGGGDTLILCGDAPFMDAGTITAALEAHRQAGAAVTVVSAIVDDPTGYGRIVRDQSGNITAIVEQKDAGEEQRRIREVNSGTYWFNTAALLELLSEITCNNAQGEYYLTDAIAIAICKGQKALAFTAESAQVVLGANDRKGLFALHECARNAVIDKQFAAGVGFESLDGVLIGSDVVIGEDTTIRAGTILKGKTVIGKGCVLGPNTVIENCTVGDGCLLNSVQAYQSVLHHDVKIGPFVHVRPHSEIKSGVKIGDFVEIKNSIIGERTAVAHLTYVGDSDVGSHVNFGCGVVTVNYDGKTKSRTTIGDNAFIGCNTNLIAPVKIGNGAYTAAGSTVTKDVPDDALVIERGEQRIKEGYALRKLKKKD